MPIQENALNAALAEALAAHPDLTATPEETRARTGAKRCDIQVRSRGAGGYYTAVECKIGHDERQQRAAVQDAQRWLDQPDCWGAVAVCYPRELADSAPQSPLQRMQATQDLHMVQVDRSGPTSPWIIGGAKDLARLASDAQASDTGAITRTLGDAIVAASDHIDETTGEELAETLQLPWEPRGNQPMDPRPARIACLLIANMALLQHRLRRERLVPGLESLIDILQAASSKQLALLDNWKRIRAVDYAPVVDPALAVLDNLATEHRTEEGVLRPLLTAVLECAGRMRGLQLDHAGPLYHRLLDTARYDGSFYTSTAASVLLAELAMPTHWLDDWSDASRLTDLKICDPACGTGTLLMAAARTLEARYRGARTDLEALHLGLVEDVLHGFDINRHAIHLAASMLTLSAPRIDYNRMNLYNMKHGVDADRKVRAGSLDILVNEAVYMPTMTPETSQRRATSTGYATETPDLLGRCDLVIMNPPFTRNDIRNRSLAPEHRRLVQRHEVELASNVRDHGRRAAIDQTSVRTFFAPIADLLLGTEGTLALVEPFTACTSASGKGERDLLTDPARFNLELVVTSHDNRRIYFSENTNIHESLIVARRPSGDAEAGPTTFVSLADNPATASGARVLAEAIQSAMAGDLTGLSNYGNLATRTLDQLRGKPWNAACFYDQSLADAYDMLTDLAAVAQLGTLAAVEPGGQRVRDAFKQAKQRQSPDMRALWRNQSERQTTMRTTADTFLVPKPGRQDYAAMLWAKRGHLLLANRLRLNLTRTPAVYADEPALGSAFIPVVPQSRHRKQACKAWCAWLNATPGIVAYLNIRQKQLTYPNFSLDGLRSLPVPTDACDLASLATAFDELAGHRLAPLPQMAEDPIRQRLDDAVAAAVPGLDAETLADWRGKIPLEPSVNNEREPFRLP